jgi:hypothetical protein
MDASYAELAAAVDKVSQERLRAMVCALLRDYPVISNAVAEELLTAHEDLEDEESESCPSDFDADNALQVSKDEVDGLPYDITDIEKKRKRAESGAELPLKRTKRYENCVNCKAEYDITLNSKHSCRYHPGEFTSPSAGRADKP